MTGYTLAHYRITAELGRGGMGIVYRAEDTKLDRTVALKVLPPHSLASEQDRARFYREARAAARLNHAHIATVYEISEAAFRAGSDIPPQEISEAAFRAGSDIPPKEIGEAAFRAGSDIPPKEISEAAVLTAKDDLSAAASSSAADIRPFIAMEYVDGESLADRVAKGPLRLDEAVRIASQIAEALGAAHEAGVVHRDIKSGNVMLTAKGAVKVLDFGLAKTAASTQLTRQGSTLGTIAYMSPEQARGEEVDRRTDLWALGVVLYEMIAGRLPFSADYEQAVLYGILNEQAEPLTALRTGVPMELEAVVMKLLRKEARLRYQSAAGVLADLETITLTTRSGSQAAGSRSVILPGGPIPETTRSGVVSGSGSASRSGTTDGDLHDAEDTAMEGDGESGEFQRRSASGSRIEAAPASRWRRYALWFGFVGVLLGALATAALMRGNGAGGGDSSQGDVVRSTIVLPPDHPLAIGDNGLSMELDSVDLTEDGSTLVYVGLDGDHRKLMIRDMKSGAIRVLDETTDASNPSFSPDGREVVYVAGSAIYRVSVDGGRPTYVTSYGGGAGMNWGRDGYIYAVDLQGTDLVRVSPEGERTNLLPGVRCDCALPSRAPGDFGVVFSGRDREVAYRMDDAGVVDTTSIRGDHVRFLSAGYVLYTRTGTLQASRWDPETGEIGGLERTVIEDLRTGSIARSGHYAVSAAGTLVYLAGLPSGVVTLIVRETDGTETDLPIPQGVYGPLDVSPDGERLLITSYDAGGNTLLVDLETGTQRTVAVDGGGRGAIWSFDGQDYLVAVRSENGYEIRRQNPDRSGSSGVIVRSSTRVRPSAMSADGKWLAYENSSGSGLSLVVRSLVDSSETVISLGRSESVWAADFSRDSRYLTYTRVGDEGSQVYVNTVPPTETEWIVSAGGGEEGDWLPDRDALIYRQASVWSIVDVTMDASEPRFASPRQLFEGPYVNIAGIEYRVLSGGRILLQRPLNTTRTIDRLEVVTNWFTELDRVLR